MNTETKTGSRPSEVPHPAMMAEVPVFITKSNFFRVIHVDGFFGGGTPTPGDMMLTVYSHRAPFPEKTVLDGMGNEITSKRAGNLGIEHEYEASLVMNLATAKALLSWLGTAINNTEDSLKQMKLAQLLTHQK